MCTRVLLPDVQRILPYYLQIIRFISVSIVMTMSVVLRVVLVMMATGGVWSSQDILHKLTVTFGKEVDACKNELKLPDTMAQEFYNFWKPDYQTSDPQVGCVMICISQKHNLIASNGTMHHENAQDYVKRHGGDETLAKQLVEMMHACENSVPATDQHCQRALSIGMCFKAEIHKQNWAPDPELVLAEVI
nr:odorant-binding protein 26 [Diaphania glauculalis]